VSIGLPVELYAVSCPGVCVAPLKLALNCPVLAFLFGLIFGTIGRLRRGGHVCLTGFIVLFVSSPYRQ
jgi:hypothetical protein